MDDRLFCQGYFHVDRCFEWRQDTLCLHQEKCQRFGVRGLAQLQDATGTVYSREYVNVTRGDTETNLHVEDLMCSDEALDEHLRGNSRPKILTLYITYQPCHHSGGHRRLKHRHAKSCCELLCAWARDVLRPANASLLIKCFSLYRVQWTDDSLFRRGDEDLFGSRVTSASNGLAALLREPNVWIEMMDPDAWHQFFVLFFVWNPSQVATVNADDVKWQEVGSSRVDLQACKLEYSIVSPK